MLRLRSSDYGVFVPSCTALSANWGKNLFSAEALTCPPGPVEAPGWHQAVYPPPALGLCRAGVCLTHEEARKGYHQRIQRVTNKPHMQGKAHQYIWQYGFCEDLIIQNRNLEALRDKIRVESDSDYQDLHKWECHDGKEM